MEDWEYWTLIDDVTVIQAALMAADLNPSEWEYEVDSRDPNTMPNAFEPVRKLIVNAVLRGNLSAYQVDDYGENGQNLGLCERKTTIARDDLIDFFEEKGLKSRYFEKTGISTDPQNSSFEFYSLKLDAAIAAWKAVTKEKHRLNKCTPKQAIETWLRENAKEYNLIKKNGTTNEKGIEEISKVANWQIQGGAPSVVAKYPVPPPKKIEPPKTSSFSFDDLDSDVPF